MTRTTIKNLNFCSLFVVLYFSQRDAFPLASFLLDFCHNLGVTDTESNASNHTSGFPVADRDCVVNDRNSERRTNSSDSRFPSSSSCCASKTQRSRDWRRPQRLGACCHSLGCSWLACVCVSRLSTAGEGIVSQFIFLHASVISCCAFRTTTAVLEVFAHFFLFKHRWYHTRQEGYISGGC